MVKFLNLSNSDSGDARRHVPFASIIHKQIFPILFSLVFVFCILCVPDPVAANALPSGFTPSVSPVYNTDIINLQNAVGGLTPDQLSIFHTLVGGYTLSQSGNAGYGVSFDDYSDETIQETLQRVGEKFVDDLFSPVVYIDQKVFTPTLNLLNGCLQYSLSHTLSDFTNRLHRTGSTTGFSDGIFLPVDSSSVISFNEFFAINSGLYNWQFDSGDWTAPFNWRQTTLAGVYLEEYNAAVQNLGFPREFVSVAPVEASGINYYNLVISAALETYDIFIDTDDHYIYFHNAPYNLPVEMVGWNSYYTQVIDIDSEYISFPVQSYNPAQFSNYSDIVNYYLSVYYSSSSRSDLLAYIPSYYGTLVFNYSTLVNDVYFGEDWDHRTILNNSTDFGFTQSVDDLLTVPRSPQYVDLSSVIAAIQQLGSNVGDLRQIIIDNSYDPSTGNVVTNNDYYYNTQTVNIPESGLSFDDPTLKDSFSSLFAGGTGTISYVWYMTKPLVQFTRSCIDMLTFGPEGSFSETGPGIFVVGIVGLGLIGGFIAKCLL